jgi:PleD family two-component response regulator
MIDRAALADGLGVTVTIGVTEVDPAHRPADVLAAADTRLYAAKRAGRNRVCS